MATSKKKMQPAGASAGGGAGADSDSSSDEEEKLDIEHALAMDYDDVHTRVKGDTEGGACLRFHGGVARYEENSCAYRWQCREFAKSNYTDVFDDRSEVLANSQFSGASGTFGERYASRPWYVESGWAIPSDKDDWAIEGPAESRTLTMVSGEEWTVEAGANFKGARVPWWNNAHHLIPKSTFWKTLDDVEDKKVSQLLKISLAKAEYNIHHGLNMFFLPQDQEIAERMLLPRHLGFTSGRDSFNHPDYNDLVQTRLNEVMDEYKKTCRDAIDQGEDHEMPDAQLTKKKLEKVSKDCADMIKEYGVIAAGEQLDKLKAAGY